MKIVTTILSIYILGLSCITCNDVITNDVIDETVSIQKIEQHSDSDQMDLCSPFCSCQCCQVNIDTTPLQTYTLMSEELFSLIFSYHNMNVQSVTYSLFQPPRA